MVEFAINFEIHPKKKNPVKKSILILSVFLCFLANFARARQNHIDYLFVDEIKQTLSIYGQFEIILGNVFIQDHPLQVLDWSDTLIICNIPDTGIASCGEVLIVNRLGDSSNIRTLSSYWFTITYVVYTSGGPVHVNNIYRWNLQSRVDIASSSFQGSFFSSICSHSSFNLSVYVSTDPGNNGTGMYGELIRGEEILPWIRPDSSYDSGFSVQSHLTSNSFPQIKLGIIRGTVTRYDSTAKSAEAWEFDPNYANIERFLQVDKDNHIVKYEYGDEYHSYYLLIQPDSDKFVPSSLKVNSVLSEEPTLTIYPNPSQGLIELSSEGISEASVYSITGERVFESRATSGDLKKIDLTTLSNGSYYIVLQKGKTLICRSLTLFK